MTNPGYTNDEISEIARLLREGWSAGQIATPLGRTRNAIVGVVHRHPRLKAIGFTNKPPAVLAIGRKRKALKRARAKAAAAGMVVDDIPVEVIYPMPVEETPPPIVDIKVNTPEPIVVSLLRDVPLTKLGPTQCKWPMWDETVLAIEDKTFCCAPRHRDHSYCAKHRMKAYAAVRGHSERKSSPTAQWKALAKGAL